MAGSRGPRSGGTYALIVEVPEPTTVAVGALGSVEFDAGWYVYVGSALGPGGFGRVDRHRRVASGDHEVRHWHVDYLLGETRARIDAVAAVAGRDVECRLARELGGHTVPGFGASDCNCDGHLDGFETREAAVRAVERAHRNIRIDENG